MSGNTYASLLWLLLAFHTIYCRRYDVNEEAMKLYGQDLSSVLERFRRTPEYLKILSDQMQQLYKTFEAVRDRTVYIYSLRLMNRVIEHFNNDTDISKIINEEQIFTPPEIPRTRSDKSPVNLLDSYQKFHEPLTLNEKNWMKELAFEYVGRWIHTMIESMTPDNTLSLSTLLPYGGGQADKTTTIHHHQNHEITKYSTNIELETGTTFNYRHSTTMPTHHRNFGLPDNLI